MEKKPKIKESEKNETLLSLLKAIEAKNSAPAVYRSLKMRFR